MNIFRYLDYRLWLKDHLETKPHKGRGELSKWAKCCSAHPTLISLILRGDRDLSLEQAYALGGYLEFTPLELDYFIYLVQFERAGNHEFKKHIQKKLESIKAQATEVKNLVTHKSELSEKAKLTFYSSYIYSAVRLYCDTQKEGRTFEEIQKKFNMSRHDLFPIIQFLEETGLIKIKNEYYFLGPSITLVNRGSPYVVKHHQNWRMQATLKSERLKEDELMFTCPMSISKNDFQDFKQELSQIIQKFSKMLKDSPAEGLGCFNLDWFWVD
jgi:uncharacterized protein (TIGR02147 family)